MTSRHVTIFASALISGLLTQASYAQPIPGMSPKEKAALQEKEAQEKDIDKAYKSMLKRVPDADKNVNADPWGSVRAPAPGK